MNELDLKDLNSMRNPLRALIITSRGLKKKIIEELKKNGIKITLEEFLVLSHILGNEGILQKDLQNKVDKDRAGMSRVIESLIKKGFAYKEFASNDSKKYQVFSTQEAREIDLIGIENSILKDMCSDFPDEKVKIILQFFKNITQNYSEYFPKIEEALGF